MGEYAICVAFSNASSVLLVDVFLYVKFERRINQSLIKLDKSVPFQHTLLYRSRGEINTSFFCNFL